MAKYFTWAGTEPNRRHGDQHYLVVGASGSGKSTLLNHMMQSVISDPEVRALVYDPKQELVPFLLGIRGFDRTSPKFGSSISILHPFDSRGMAWDMAADVDDVIGARQLATILVPDPVQGGSSEGFFTNAVRDILSGVLLAFIECVPNAKSWTFRDVLLTLLYEPYLNFVLDYRQTRDGRPFPLLHRLRESYFAEHVDERTASNIRASLNVKLALYEPVAAAWHKAASAPLFGGYFSLRSWIDEKPGRGRPGSILVLGNDEAARAALDPINQAIFKRATKLVLARKERTQAERDGGTNQIWFFLDEVREAGKLDGLGRLLTKGRSKNACVAMGFQDVDGMREVYGKEVANELCAQFNNVAMLRVNSPETAQWASDLFGRRIDVSRSSSTSVSLEETSTMSFDRGESEEERPFLYTETFLYGTNAAASKSVVGYRKGPDIQVESLSRDQARAEFRFEEDTEVERVPQERLAERLEAELRTVEARHLMALVSAFDPRPSGHQYLQPWTQNDFVRLGIAGDPPDWSVSRKVNKKKDKPDEINFGEKTTTFEDIKATLRKFKGKE